MLQSLTHAHDTALSKQPNSRDTVMRFCQAFDDNTLDRFDAVDSAFEARVFGATVLDWQGFLAFGQAFLEGFPEGRHLFDFVVAEGDLVATIGHYTGRHERPFMGVPATGREVDFRRAARARPSPGGGRRRAPG